MRFLTRQRRVVLSPNPISFDKGGFFDFETSSGIWRRQISENTKKWHNPPAQPQHTQGHPPMRSLGHWVHFRAKFTGLKRPRTAARMGNISESAPAVVQLVIHRLGRKKYRVHVVLPTCQCSRSRRGSRGPAVDAESCIDHSFGIFEKRAPKQ